MKRFFFICLVPAMFISCSLRTTEVEYVGVKSDGELFVDSLFGVVNDTKHYVDQISAECMMLEMQEDFNGDGVKDALVTDVQACGGNAIGNSFFFVTYKDGQFVCSNNFGDCVYDDPVIEPWEGMKSVVITDTKFNEYTEETERHKERYVLVDTFALRAESPVSIIPMPSISVEDWKKESELEDMDGEMEMSPEDSAKYAGYSIFEDLYSGKCSWYCGGEVQGIVASSNRKGYDADNAHDFDHTTVWSPTGSGIGESLVYKFRGSCPRITTVQVLNGDVQSEDLWLRSARVKLMRMYVNDKPYALLAFEDSRTQQCFNVGIVGFYDDDAPDWTLTFEILEVYPGTMGGVAIAELNFDGIDVH